VCLYECDYDIAAARANTPVWKLSSASQKRPTSQPSIAASCGPEFNSSQQHNSFKLYGVDNHTALVYNVMRSFSPLCRLALNEPVRLWIILSHGHLNWTNSISHRMDSVTAGVSWVLCCGLLFPTGFRMADSVSEDIYNVTKVFQFK